MESVNNSESSVCLCFVCMFILLRVREKYSSLFPFIGNFFFPQITYLYVCFFFLPLHHIYIFFNAVSTFFPLTCLTMESLQFCILQGIFFHKFLSVTLFHISSVITVISGMDLVSCIVFSYVKQPEFILMSPNLYVYHLYRVYYSNLTPAYLYPPIR